MENDSPGISIIIIMRTVSLPFAPMFPLIQSLQGLPFLALSPTRSHVPRVLHNNKVTLSSTSVLNATSGRLYRGRPPSSKLEAVHGSLEVAFAPGHANGINGGGGEPPQLLSKHNPLTNKAAR